MAPHVIWLAANSIGDLSLAYDVFVVECQGASPASSQV